MGEVKVYVPESTSGYHNQNIGASVSRMIEAKAYRDLSTVMIVLVRGSEYFMNCQQCGAPINGERKPDVARKGPSLFPRWVQHKDGLMKPMNQKTIGPIYIEGAEVGQGYNWAVEWIQTNFPDYKFMLTYEDDILPPPDALVKLYEGTDEYDVVQALYWTKGELGQPMIYGDINDPVINFRPQPPKENVLQRCYGLGMGFNLFKMEQFKKVPKPWFQTEQSWNPNVGARSFTQDLYYYEKANHAGAGLKFAVDTRVKVGHWDMVNDQVW